MDVIYFFAEHPTALLLVTAILSLVIGSFLNVVIHRLPQMMEHAWSEECRIFLGLKPHQEAEKINLCLPMSHCPQCKHVIKPWHNIPLLSYLFLRGQCAYCSAKISMRYPLVEAMTCVLSIYVVWKFGFTWQSAAALTFTWIIICLTFIDLDHHLLPDQLTLLLLWIGLSCSIFSIFCDSHDAIMGAILGYLVFAVTQWVFERITGKTGMGQGDFKFLAALGAFIGWKMLPLIILFASISGILFAVMHMVIKHEYKSVPLPFGPYLAVAGWIALLWGNEVMQYYLSIV